MIFQTKWWELSFLSLSPSLSLSLSLALTPSRCIYHCYYSASASASLSLCRAICGLKQNKKKSHEYQRREMATAPALHRKRYIWRPQRFGDAMRSHTKYQSTSYLVHIVIHSSKRAREGMRDRASFDISSLVLCPINTREIFYNRTSRRWECGSRRVWFVILLSFIWHLVELKSAYRRPIRNNSKGKKIWSVDPHATFENAWALLQCAHAQASKFANYECHKMVYCNFPLGSRSHRTRKHKVRN